MQSRAEIMGKVGKQNKQTKNYFSVDNILTRIQLNQFDR
jgi:hypothetical protein